MQSQYFVIWPQHEGLKISLFVINLCSKGGLVLLQVTNDSISIIHIRWNLASLQGCKFLQVSLSSQTVGTRLQLQANVAEQLPRHTFILKYFFEKKSF